MIDAPPGTSSSPRLSGYLRVACERRPDGQCILTRKEYRVPIHISKPYWDGHTLLLNVMSPTAGMLEGDRVDVDVRVHAGAALAISNPSSLRIHKMSPQGIATWQQRFAVESGAFLECNPEWLIPQAESAFEQTTEIDIADGGALFFIEAIAPGRAAHGETLAFRAFRNRLTLRYGGKLAAMEKHSVEPSRNTHRAWTAFQSAAPFYASIFAVFPDSGAADAWEAEAHRLKSDGLEIGASQLAVGPCRNAKILSADPTLARAAINLAREAFYRAIGHPAPALRRN